KELHGNRVIATDLANPDFVAMARSFGVDADRVQTPDALKAAVAAAAERRKPCLIEVPVGDMPSPWRFLDMPRIRGLA
ncbi:thiamine pyrophosphate-dependent enzyme, partial [Escherichia coli]|uniref:thiamine pyrophosphate-dependent enzyme n=1 Tax=Escherichia coli TaxID=562 RepID=UPI00207CEF9D